MEIRRNIWYLLLAAVLIIPFGCKKSGTNCYTSAGTVILEKRNLSDFDSIDVGGYVNLFLTQDSIDAVTVESGKNVISGITTEVSNGLLVIRNTNECNWLRSYNVPVDVYISVKHLLKIYYEASGNVTSTNTLISNSLGIIAWGGCGSIKVDMNVQSGYFSLQQGTVDLTLRGHCSISSIFAGDYGAIDCKDLTTGFTFVTNQGSNYCYVQAAQYLEATIKSIGNIYYSGTPDSVITHIKGSGKVIHL